MQQRAVWLALCTFSSLQVFYLSTQGVLVVEGFLMLESLDFTHFLAAVFLLGMMVGALATMLMIKCGLCGFGQKRSALPGPWHVQKIQKILPEEIYICRSSRCFHVNQTCQKNVQTFPICQHCLKHEIKKNRWSGEKNPSTNGRELQNEGVHIWLWILSPKKHHYKMHFLPLKSSKVGLLQNALFLRQENRSSHCIL